MSNKESFTIITGFGLVATLYFVYIKYYKKTKQDKKYNITSTISTKKTKLIEDTINVKGALDVSLHDSYDLETSTHTTGFPTLGLERPMVIAMVGLPARGKSYIVKMMIRYFSWTGLTPKVFNVGSYRRSQGMQGASSKFFSATNNEGKIVREKMAMAVQDEMYKWLQAGTISNEQRIAIFDATNTTINRRYALTQRSRKENVFLLFVESICNDTEVLQRNYELKLQNEDYKNMDPIKARKDFEARVKAYEAQYETIEDYEDHNKISYIKLVNVGQKVISRNCLGYLPSQVSFYLQNVHISPRKICLALNAEQSYDKDDSYRGNVIIGEGRLTDNGREFSLDLAKFIETQYIRKDLENEFLVLAGTSKAHSETIMHLRMMCPCFTTTLLNELRAGDLHGLSRENIKKLYPEEWDKRQNDKLHYRYPGVGGESYLDVIERIRPVIIELERQRRSLLVVTHLAVLRCIYAYFMGTNAEKIPFIPINSHQIIELSPGPFGCELKIIDPKSETENF